MIQYICSLPLILRYAVLGLLLSGTTCLPPAQAQRINPPQAGLGQAVPFDGTDDYVAIDGMNYGGSQTAVTVEAWVRTTAAGSQTIASFDKDEYWSLETNGGQVVWNVATSAGNISLSSSGAINDGQWHHVAAVYDGGVATVYIDGVADATATQGTSLGSGVTRFGFVGAASQATAFDTPPGTAGLLSGAVDEVRIWSTARTATEIEEGRYRQFTGLESGLMLYYDHEESSGATVADRTANGYTGALRNASDASRINGGITAGNAIPDQIAVGGEKFPKQESNTFPSSVFADDQTINSYQATQADGRSLPAWLKFNTTDGTFSGTPPNVPTSFTVKVTATDTDGHTADDVFNLQVRAVPSVILDANAGIRGYETSFSEGDPPVSITATRVAIEDLDNAFLTEFNINLLNNIDEDTLILTTEGKNAAATAGITVQDYNSVSGSIVLTGVATLAEYAEVLEWVQYFNRREDPTAGTRIVSFIATDQDGNPGSAASLVTVSSVNDSPSLDVNGPDPRPNHTVTYVEDTPPVKIADDVELDDIDYHDLGSVSITIVNRIDTTEETLQTVAALPAGITASFNDSTGVLQLVGSASLDDYEEAIQRVGYQNASQDPDLTQRRLLVVFDDGDGGESTSSATVLVDIVPVNDPPEGPADTVVVAEYSRNNIVSTTPPTDIDNELSELTIQVISLPDLGRLIHADGTPVQAGDILDSARFVELQYNAPDNYDGTSSPGSLTYNVSDGNLNAQGTVVFLINNAPEAENIIVTTPEDIPYVFTLADFADGYTDTEGDALTHVVINRLPADGWLLLGEDTVRTNDEIRLTALDSGKLILIPEPNVHGNPYTSFLFRVKDERAATSLPYEATMVVLPVSDPPQVDTVIVTGEEYQTLFFTVTDFRAQFSDPENDTLTKVRIESLPTNGILSLNGQPVAIEDEVAVDSLNQLAFEPDPGFDGITEFRWNGHDGSAYAEQPGLVIIIILEDNRIAAQNDTIRLIDITTYDGLLVELVSNPTGGDFIFRTNPVVEPEHGRVRLREDGTYTYEVADGFTGTDAFTYQVCNTNTPPECAQATVTIIVPPPLLVYEGFSPDNDGTNDVWRIRGIEDYPDNRVRVFNRWGNLVFEVAGYNNEDRAWSSYSTAGLVTGDVPDGTYFYLIDLGNGHPPRSGYVIVNR